MKAYVIVEGQSVATLLRRLLSAEQMTDLEIVVAGKRTTLVSLASTLLSRRQSPTVIVLDSESISPSRIQERRALMEELMHMAGGDIPAKVIMAIPQIEIVFFHAPSVLERLFQRKLPSDVLAMAPSDPAGALQRLAEQSNCSWDMEAAVAKLSDEDVAALRSAPVIKELSDFLAQANGQMEQTTKQLVQA